MWMTVCKPFRKSLQPNWSTTKRFVRLFSLVLRRVVVTVFSFLSDLFGGSHGGFLVTHLSGQRPDLFSATATRNPVTDVACMSSLTDIPDWCYTECGLDYSRDHLPSTKDYETMLKCSPIYYADKVKAPLLMLLGASDLRVPNAQAINYFKFCKSKGTKAR
jgi:acylaminoacyl-peptidase